MSLLSIPVSQSRSKRKKSEKPLSWDTSYTQVAHILFSSDGLKAISVPSWFASPAYSILNHMLDLHLPLRVGSPACSVLWRLHRLSLPLHLPRGQEGTGIVAWQVKPPPRHQDPIQAPVTS